MFARNLGANPFKLLCGEIEGKEKKGERGYKVNNQNSEALSPFIMLSKSQIMTYFSEVAAMVFEFF